jgi:ribosome biogenesis protein ERB1
MVRKFVSNLNTITHISVHKNGDDVLAGSKDGKVAWFQLELNEKPFKMMDYHGDKIRNVAYHNNYPLFSSCSRNGKLLIYHATLSEDLLQDPVIVPLKVLANNKSKSFILILVMTYSCFHPKHPWIFSSGEDNLIRLWC